jgi:glycerate kinase
MTATSAAEAMITGIRKAVPDAIIDCCPIADGGEGTLTALLTAIPGDLHRVIVSGPLNEPVEAVFATFTDSYLASRAAYATYVEESFAVVESAAAAGLQLVPEESRNPEKTGSRGVGELIAAACAETPKKIIVAVGGSATNDGGCGMAQALGIRFLDSNGDEIRKPISGGMLSDLSRIDATWRLPALSNIEMMVACDVRNPLTGPDGAAYVYGPQKGASVEQLAMLDAGLAHLADLVRRDLNVDIEELPGSGAAGGLGGGLVAFTGATISSGIDTILDAVEFDRRVRCCDLCLTGEGRIDAQSVSGKACMGVARAASKHGVPTIALVGQVGSGAEQCLAAGLHDYIVIGEGLPAELSMRQARVLTADAAGQVARDYLESMGSDPIDVIPG